MLLHCIFKFTLFIFLILTFGQYTLAMYNYIHHEKLVHTHRAFEPLHFPLFAFPSVFPNPLIPFKKVYLLFPIIFCYIL